MRFVDLFAGLGGFHLALRKLEHHCVYACELNDDLREIYALNFGIEPFHDIRLASVNDIPAHDILCAGFPCQPFSKAGDRKGLECPKWGDLFTYTSKIIKKHKPSYLILENVPNLVRHDDGRTWTGMKQSLKALGYDVKEKHLSPHWFGIPQVRDRVFIVGSRFGLDGFAWPERKKNPKLSIESALLKKPKDAKPISAQVERCLDAWQEFIQHFPSDLPYFPIWSMEFGADYPYRDETPYGIGLRRLCRYKGSHGSVLRTHSAAERMSGLPSYARVEQRQFPDWKIKFIDQNRELYARHKRWLDSWLPRILDFPSSLQKLEWHCKGEERDIWRYVIQFRASGVRVKRPTTAPSLVAMTTTQVPIIAWERRYMTPRECSKLQSMAELKHLPRTPEKAFRAFGNAVNAKLVQMIAERLLGSATREIVIPTAKHSLIEVAS
jgi:DNA (cytosine-5)-methyltransferase 1